MGISSLIDTWLLLSVVRSGGERNRTLTVVKSRGMAHSNQAVEFHLGAQGVTLVDTYLGPEGVLTGSARIAQEAQNAAEAERAEDEIARRKDERARRRKIVQSQIVALREELANQDAEIDRVIRTEERRRELLRTDQQRMAASRQAFRPARRPRDGRRP